VLESGFKAPVASDLELARKAIHEARQLRDAGVIFLTPCG
jgi:hypothetical protein